MSVVQDVPELAREDCPLGRDGGDNQQRLLAFLREQREPVVLKGLAHGWPAMDWTPDELQRFAGGLNTR